MMLCMISDKSSTSFKICLKTAHNTFLSCHSGGIKGHFSTCQHSPKLAMPTCRRAKLS